MRTLAPPTSVVIEKIIESFVHLGVPALKKEQTMLAIEGFAPLILSLPGIAEPSPEFFWKGTPIVPAIRRFDPLVLLKSIQGIYGAPSPKTLEVALPSQVIIGLKMFSLAPNLQTQEGLVIRMSKPFPYKDSHRVPWKYDVTLIST